jgi:2-polyprenyl-6-methoxyphenol hydroxylase-like FAD-dependent oxidoreductase
VVKQQSVLISGIGIAGPTLAYWLGESGYKPTLVDRAPRLRSGGYVIDFWGLGYDIAERMGLLPDLQSVGYNFQEVRFVDARGKRASGFDVEIFRALTDGRYFSLPRSELSRLIYRKIESRAELIFNDCVVSMTQDDDGVNVTFERAPPRRYDLVIGADGLHSAIRNLTFGREERFEKYLGYVVAAFQTVGYPHRDELVFVTCGVPGKQASRFAMRDDRSVFLFVFASERPPRIDPHDIRAQKALLHAQFDHAGWECPQILAALDACDDLYFDPVSQIRMDTWSRGRVALIGDAAFCPSLLAGQGSALAMVAAYVLAGELGRSPEHPAEAFANYERLLRPFIDGKQNAAEKFASSFAPKTRFGLFVRNQVIKLFAIPKVAKLTLGGSLLDQLDLPDYAAFADYRSSELSGFASVASRTPP